MQPGEGRYLHLSNLLYESTIQFNSQYITTDFAQLIKLLMNILNELADIWWTYIGFKNNQGLNHLPVTMLATLHQCSLLMV